MKHIAHVFAVDLPELLRQRAPHTGVRNSTRAEAKVDSRSERTVRSASAGDGSARQPPNMHEIDDDAVLWR